MVEEIRDFRVVERREDKEEGEIEMSRWKEWRKARRWEVEWT